MKYKQTIEKLMQDGLINTNDKFAFCKYYNKLTAGDIFWAAGGLVSFRWTDYDYLLSTDGKVIKIFNIDKKTGEYTGQSTTVEKEIINKLTCKKYALIELMGRYKIDIHAKSIKFMLNAITVPTFKGFDQSANYKELINALQHF